jgi:hypothetical protein
MQVAINSYGQNWADSIFYSSIRPNEELKLHTLYTDTLEYLEFDDNYDDFLILVKKDDETFGTLICNDIHDLNLNRGDIVEIQWAIDSLRPEGDKELLWFREYVIEITKIKDGKKEILPADSAVIDITDIIEDKTAAATLQLACCYENQTKPALSVSKKNTYLCTIRIINRPKCYQQWVATSC